MHNTINIYIGDDKEYAVAFTDGDGVAIDITGWTVILTIKDNEDDGDADALVQVKQTSHTNPTAGQTTITIPRSTTIDLTAGSYYYDIQITNATGKVKTITKGSANILKHITHAIS